MGQRARRIWRWIAGTLAVGVILAALGVAALRVAFDRLPGYQAETAARVKALTGLELRFSRLDARLGWRGPEIFFENASVLAPDGQTVLVSADAGRVSLALWRSAWQQRIEVGSVSLEGPRLNLVIFPDGHVELVGQAALKRTAPAGTASFNLRDLRHGRLLIRDAVVRFVDQRSNESWQVTGVNLDLTRDSAGLRFDGHVDLPRQLGSSIDVDGEALGDLGELATVRWKARASARDADLGGWARLLPASLAPPVSGRGYARVMAFGTGRQLDGGRVALELRDLRVTVADGSAPAAFRVIAGEFKLAHAGQHWTLTGTDVELSRPESPWQPSPLEIAATVADGRLRELSVVTPYVNLTNLAPLAALLPVMGTGAAALALDPSGVLRNVDIGLVWNEPGPMPAVTGAIDFAGLGFGALGKGPGLRGLDGRVEGSGETGRVTLSADALQFVWPTQFRDVIVANMTTTAGWKRVPNGVQLWADDCRLDTGRGRANARLRMLLGHDGASPLLDLSGTVNDGDVADVWRYLPIGKLSASALGWLDPAFRAGRVTHGSIEITGPLAGFPYREGQGRFLATAHTEGVTLDYARGWAPLEGVTADAEFAGVSMRVRSSGGTVHGVPLGPATAEIADWRQTQLVVRAEASAPVGPVLALLQQSPLGPTLGPAFMALRGTGLADGVVLLYLPVKQFADRAITATVRLDNAGLRLEGLGEEVSRLNGVLTVNNREIYLPRFTAEFLGGSVGGSLDTRGGKGEALQTTLLAQGTFDGARLQKLGRLPTNAGLAGHSDWRARLLLDRPGPREPSAYQVELTSSLVGLETALPAPFAKPAPRALPVAIDVRTRGPDTVLAHVSVGDQTRGAIGWRRTQDQWELYGGEVLFGGGPDPVVTDEPGLQLRGSLARASLSEVLALRWPEPARRRVQDWLAGIDLSVGEAEALGYVFERASVRMRPGNRAWEVAVDGPATGGRLTVPFDFPGEVPLVIDMDRLHAGERVRTGAGELDPRRLPSIRFDVRDLVFDKRRFGHVRAELDRGTQGLSAGLLEVTHKDFRASGHGSWMVDGTGAQRCGVTLEATTTNMLGFLTAMGYGPWIEAAKGRAKADLNWPGAPDGTFHERLSGTLNVALAEGKIPDVDPGAGRVLGLMSIAHLPRRLAFDFKDVTGSGLAFDTIAGDFTLRDGVAYTRNLALRGPAAEIGVVGTTNLRTRQYDQIVVVTGDVGSTIGIAGALAAGPAVGAALLLFSRVFKEPLSGMTRGYYRISGPWEQPGVQRIDAQAAKEPRGAADAAVNPASGGSR